MIKIIEQIAQSIASIFFGRNADHGSGVFQRVSAALFLVACCLVVPLHADSDTKNSKIRVALFLDKGAHPRNNLRVALETASDMTLTTLDGELNREGDLKNFDVLVVPGGSAKRESFSMKAEGRLEVRRFVHEGGLYMGICAGCYLITEAKSTDIGLLPLTTRDKHHWERGKGHLSVELTPLGMEVFGTTQSHWSILYHNGPVIDASHVTPESAFSPLGYYRSELVKPGGIPGLMVNSPAMFMGRFGKGRVIGISPHPEASPEQVFMELNAIRWLYRTQTLSQKEG